MHVIDEWASNMTKRKWRNDLPIFKAHVALMAPRMAIRRSLRWQSSMKKNCTNRVSDFENRLIAGVSQH